MSSGKATRLCPLKTTGRIRTRENEGKSIQSERWERLKSETRRRAFNEKSQVRPSQKKSQVRPSQQDRGQRVLCFGLTRHFARRVHSAGNHAAFGPLPPVVFHGADPSSSWLHRPGQALRARLSGKCHNGRDGHKAPSSRVWTSDVAQRRVKMRGTTSEEATEPWRAPTVSVIYDH